MAHGEISDYVLTCCRISVFSPPANNKRQTMNSKFTTKALRTHRSTKYRMLTLKFGKPTPFLPLRGGEYHPSFGMENSFLNSKIQKTGAISE